MDRIMVTASLQAANTDARETLLELLKSVADYAWKHEPGTLRYCVCKPYEEDDGVSIYVIEEFANGDAKILHNQSQPLATFNEAVLSKSQNSLLATEPLIHTDKTTLSTGEVSSYTRKNINDYSTPYIVLASVQYQSGLVTDALPGWKNIVTYCEANESEALTYTILEDKSTDVLRTVEAYESKTYAREVHVVGPAVKENQKQNGHMRVGPNAMTVKRGAKVAGYLGKF